MVAVPVDPGVSARLDRLETTLRNYMASQRPNPSTWTDTNGVVRLHINSGGVLGNDGPTTIRDAAGNVVYQDDDTAGWGLRSPVVSIAMNDGILTAGSPIEWTGSDLGAIQASIGFIYVDHARLSWSYQKLLTSNGTTTATGETWITYGSQGTLAGSDHNDSTTTQVSPTYSGTYLVPQADFGTVQQITLWQHQTAGAPSASFLLAKPRYMLAEGE